jgi:transcriptional regulator GlxA family with amidase domain
VGEKAIMTLSEALRVAAPATKVEENRQSIARVAELSGFASARDFRRVWQRHEGGARRTARAWLPQAANGTCADEPRRQGRLPLAQE